MGDCQAAAKVGRGWVVGDQFLKDDQCLAVLGRRFR